MTRRFQVDRFMMVAVMAMTLITGTPARAADGLLFDHISFSVPDPAQAVAWYKTHLGAQPDDATGVLFGTFRFRFRASPGAGPSAGSVVDHVAFSVASIDSTLAAWRTAGIAVESSPRDGSGSGRAAFIQDPWGTRIEVRQDPAHLGLHHVHLLATDRTAMLAWLSQTFGGERATRDGLDGLTFGAVLVAVDQVERAPAATTGRVADHLGWTTALLADTAAAMKRQGVTFTTEPRTVGNLTMAFVQGPSQLRVEVLQR